MYKFTELSKRAQRKAIKDYILGWLETHEDETIRYNDAYNLCLDTNEDVAYDIIGNIIED